MGLGSGKSHTVPSPNLIMWRGEAEGQESVEHGKVIHDLGKGLYLTRQRWLGEMYARKNAAEIKNRPILYRIEIDPRKLGPKEKILDLTEGETGRLWAEFIRPIISRPGMREWFKNEIFFNTLENFLKYIGSDINNYWVLISPEYVRGGEQICIRNSIIQAIVKRNFVEYDMSPRWIRVYDSKGIPIDVNINDPKNGKENKEYVKERFLANSQKQQSRTKPPVSSPRTPSVSPGSKGIAGVLAALEIARYILEVWSAIENMPSTIKRKFEKVWGKKIFWENYGVKATINAVVLSGETKSRGNTGTPNGTTQSATGRVLWGITAEDWSDVDDIDFFIGYLDYISNPNPKENPLDSNIKDLLSLIRFLADGRKLEVVLPWIKEVNLPIYKRSEWAVRMMHPKKDGSPELVNNDFSINKIIARIKIRVMDEESRKIRSMNSIPAPAGSRPYARFGQWLKVDRSKILQYKDNDDRPFYDVMQTQYGSSVAEIGDEDEWGKFFPSFYQVESDNIGNPFWIGEGILATGADVETNAFLYGYLWSRDKKALIQSYEETLPAGHGGPKSYVSSPLIYLKKNHIKIKT